MIFITLSAQGRTRWSITTQINRIHGQGLRNNMVIKFLIAFRIQKQSMNNLQLMLANRSAWKCIHRLIPGSLQSFRNQFIKCVAKPNLKSKPERENMQIIITVFYVLNRMQRQGNRFWFQPPLKVNYLPYLMITWNEHKSRERKKMAF
jgi:hypothetical protein